MQGMRGMTLKEPRASLEVKHLIIDLLELEGEEKCTPNPRDQGARRKRRAAKWRKKEQSHSENGREK